MPEHQPGDAIVVEIGDVVTGDGRTVQGAILEFPAGPPEGMTWGDVWYGNAFRLVRVLAAPETDD